MTVDNTDYGKWPGAGQQAVRRPVCEPRAQPTAGRRAQHHA
jgi:hypothetical protein